MGKVDESVLRSGYHNWYRNAEWTAEIRAAFLQKIARARSSWDQYFHIQMLHLLPDDPEAVLELAERFHERRTSPTFSDGLVYQHCANAYERLGRFEEAGESYLNAVRWQVEHPTHQIGVQLEFAYFVVRHRREQHYDAALDAIHAYDSGKNLSFPISGYRRSAALAVIHDDAGLIERAAQHAMDALAALDVATGPFERHPGMGLVRDSDPVLDMQLVAIAARLPVVGDA